MGIIKYYNLKNAEVFIFDHYVINQIREGVIIATPNDKELNEIIQEHFSGRDLVYVSNRIKSYAVDPLIYKKVEDIPNLLAIAIVPKTEIMRKNAEYEREFYHKPYGIFDSLRDAVLWTDTILNPKEG